MITWLTILGMALVTYASRAITLLALRGEVVPWLRRWLGFVPVAVFTALVVKPLPELKQTGRYHILGEIARGGIGVILKGRDEELGRDVAMKILRDEHVRSEQVVQRFIEEAQIGGQLQHPGIVPVYELGTDKDARPFFTMKPGTMQLNDTISPSTVRRIGAPTA
jgi:hypothetical protein